MSKPLTVGSTFTGIGGADLGFEWAGFDIKWQCEFDSWKQEVLRAHWPDVPLYDDITTMNDAPSVDVMLGGFPCQDLSVAGKRKGFGGERSVLAFEFLRVAELVQPRWIVLENVPGLLSSTGGRDFARLIDEVVGCGYGVAWRILDARYFGVPQRRRRVFIVARRTDAKYDSRGASRLALRALFESSGGDTSSGWQAWTETPRSVGDGAESSCGVLGEISHCLTSEGHDASEDGTGRGTPIISPALVRSMGRGAVGSTQDEVTLAAILATAFRKGKRAASDQDDETWVEGDHANTLNRFDVGDTRTTHIVVEAHGVSKDDEEVAGTLCTNAQGGQRTTDIAGAYVSQAYSIREDNAANTFSATPVDTARCLQKHQPSINSHHAQNIITETFSVYPEGGNDADIAAAKVECSPALTKVKSERGVHVAEQMSVRRLTPVECERLMGLPDGWTAPPGVKAPDSKRYAACGDAIVTTVAFWIADRIRMIEEEEAS